MEAFEDTWFQLDRKSEGWIKSDELRELMHKNGYDTVFTEKWLKLFDPDNSKFISFETYFDVLGLEPKEVKERHSKHLKTALPTDIEIISSDMSIENQLKINEIMRKAFKEHSHEKDVVKFMKQALDKEMDKLWHVIIVQGQFWCWYSHEPGFSFIYRLNGRQIYLVWKSPAP